MLRRWLSPRSAESTTADPLAAIAPGGAQRQIYSVSRSVVLPRVALRAPAAPTGGDARAGGADGGGRVNPLFSDDLPSKPLQLKHPPSSIHHLSETTPTTSGKPASSGYGSHGGSSHDPTYLDAVAVLEQNAQFVKSILVAVQNKNKSRRSVGSLGSSAGTLTTIPEGKVDFSIPRPVWPQREINNNKKDNLYDSLVDESLLLYTSLSYVPDDKSLTSANEILKDLSDTINAAVDGKTGLSPEQVLKCISDRLSTGLEVLQRSTEEDMRKLSVNLSNSEHLNTVIRAFSNSSSSGNSSQTSSKCSAVDTEDIYQVPSGCSSIVQPPLPVFIHEDLSSVRTGMRNALIYGTLLRSAAAAAPGSTERLLEDKRGGFLLQPCAPAPGLQAPPGEKPSVWEMYYGQKSEGEYFVPSGCSSIVQPPLPVFIHEDLSSVRTGMRNALIYGTLLRSAAAAASGSTERLLVDNKRGGFLLQPCAPAPGPTNPAPGLQAPPGEKPSVWEMYYGQKSEGEYFPVGRPEADFTLDVPRSELLTRRMRAAKKWRFRCRIVTSFLGLVFFLLSLMAVSLMLTRGKRMFGSMV